MKFQTRHEVNLRAIVRVRGYGQKVEVREFLASNLLPVLQGIEGQAGSIGFLKAASLLGQSLSHKQPPPPRPAPPSLCCELRAAGQSARDIDKDLKAAMGSGRKGLLGVMWLLPLLLLLILGEWGPPSPSSCCLIQGPKSAASFASLCSGHSRNDDDGDDSVYVCECDRESTQVLAWMLYMLALTSLS